jgi:hypothetical protein
MMPGVKELKRRLSIKGDGRKLDGKAGGYRAPPLGDCVHLATAEHQNTRLNPNFDAS